VESRCTGRLETMRDKPPLSVLIPWCERDELRLKLAANAPVFRAHDAEILILNCGGSSERLRGLITASEVTGIRQLDISVSRFNKSLALNVGLAHARADTVFTLDADIVLLGPLPVEAMDERSFLTIESVYESAPFDAKQTRNDSAVASAKSAILEFTFRGGVKVRHQLSLRDAFRNVRAGPPGLLLAKKGDLLNIHGYNSDLESWGWEDDDVLIRLQYALGRRRVQSGEALHLTHGDNARFLRGPRSQSDQRNFIKCCRNYNNGLFLGSYQSDIARLSDNVTETRYSCFRRR
jgi:glycosyltransferase involved in cell wall biosynthesis